MFSQKYTENIGNMWFIMINPQKPVINLMNIFNRFTALIYIYIAAKYDCIELSAQQRHLVDLVGQWQHLITPHNSTTNGTMNTYSLFWV